MKKSLLWKTLKFEEQIVFTKVLGPKKFVQAGFPKSAIAVGLT
jgi:hypothetical protein